MNGESDKMVPTKNTVDLDRRLPNSQLVVYPDAGHGGVFQFHEDFVTSAAARRSRTSPSSGGSGMPAATLPAPLSSATHRYGTHTCATASATIGCAS
jgi:hypothetical protein